MIDAPTRGIRTVIFITYYFDAGTEVGAVRTRAIAQYLPEHEWIPVVVTAGSVADDVTTPTLIVRHVPPHSAIGSAKVRLGIEVTTERPAHQGSDRAGPLGRIAGSLHAIGTEIGGLVPDSMAWAWRAAATATTLAETYSACAILSSAPSHTANLAAWWAARKRHLPWVAELRDLWAQRPYRSGTRLRRLPDLMLEKLVFRRVAALVTVSEPLAIRLRDLHPRRRIRSIPSGIDPALAAPPGVALDRDFTILYAGRIYRGRQDLGKFLKPLRTALDRGLLDPSAVRVDLLLLHPLSPDDTRIVEQLGLDDIVHVGQSVPRDEVIERERRAQILLHLRWDDPTEPGILTGKLFEYLASRRPILSTGRYRDDVVNLLEETRAGIGTTTQEATVAYLAAAFEAFRSSGKVPNEPDESRLAALDVRGTVKAIAEELDAAVSNWPSR